MPCIHYSEFNNPVPTPFGSGNVSEPMADCAIDADSDECSPDCPYYEEAYYPDDEEDDI